MSRHLTSAGVEVWKLLIPIPEAIEKNYKSHFQLPPDDDRFAERVLSDFKAAKKRPDTMGYIFEVFARLVDFANRLEESFPYQPEMFTITDEMIIGPTQ